MTAYSDGIAMKNQNDPARKDDKREWSAPKVERRSMIDRTQGASRSSFLVNEANNYTVS
jgi:hypothetical protein